MASRGAVLAAAAAVGLWAGAARVARAEGTGDDASGTTEAAGGDAASQEQAPIARYFDQLEKAGLIDVSTGNQTSLKAELARAEGLLGQGADLEAAVALYSIVESPRFRDFSDTVDYQNAEYELGVSLSKAGAYGAALDDLERVLARGPDAPYFAPGHRRAVDIALETRDYAGVLARMARVEKGSLPVEAAGEETYLKARLAYEQGKLGEAESALTTISRKSRLYSSALYLRGVIRTRRGQLKDASEAFCEIAATPDNDNFTFVVDQRYFTIKDLARLALGRIAHEVGDYDDAYYHFFQIPDDSDKLPDALFEAAWSMYQKRELGTARDLVVELRKDYPDSPLDPEAGLLAGYVDLADCKFDAAQKHYDQLVADLGPVVAEIDHIRKNPDRVNQLFARAMDRWRTDHNDPTHHVKHSARTPADKVVSLLRLDPQFVRLHEAVVGLRRAAGNAPHVVGEWRRLAARMGRQKVAKVGDEAGPDEQAAADADQLDQDARRLSDQVAQARAELRRGVRAGSLSRKDAQAEDRRLRDLATRVDALADRTHRASRAADKALADKPAAGLRGMVSGDLAQARGLEDGSRQLEAKLSAAADKLAMRSLDRLYTQTRHVLDKAKLGKIDAVIGQKRRLEIEVQDLASGRFPPELFGRLWQAGLIGDDEEYWPYQGEFWSDEYEGWR